MVPFEQSPGEKVTGDRPPAPVPGNLTLLEARSFATPAPEVEVGRFSSADFPAHRQFALWRTVVAPPFGTVERPGPYEAPFPASVVNYQTTKAGYAHHRIDCASSVTRDEKAIAHGNFDGIGVQYRLAGIETDNSFRHGTLFKPGALRIHDLRKPFSCANRSYENIALVISRDHLAERISGLGQLHGLMFPHSSAMGLMLRDHMASAIRALALASRLEAERLSDITLEMVAAALLSSRHPDIIASDSVAGALMWAIRSCIEQNLHRPSLSPDFIAHSVGISRAKLFRACQPHGTPMEMVQHHRLRRAEALIKADPDRRITDVAAMVGYENLETFSRAFKRQFGYSAQEFRQACRFKAPG